ncbi:MAG: FGGY-family carbohydrate kinase [Caldilineaceae bacterium]|nr:FGGY-family carbohydrate kinase [Caldilineaceae bacterium]MDE0339806.1 FGGY-family carbohydrate kinase [Caldilineaceae bacterium]
MTEVTSGDSEVDPSRNREVSQQDLILAVDLGSSSVRASAYLLDGTRLEETTAFRNTRQSADGTFDPHILTELTEEVISDCLARTRILADNPRFIAAAWTSFAMSWLGVDRAGRPVTPVYTYSDARSGTFADSLRQELLQRGDLEDTWQRTGTPIHTAYAPAQLLRLAAEEPGTLKQVAYWQTLAASLLARWRGQPHAPVSNSEVGWTGLLNRRTLTWDEQLVRLVGVDPRQLPNVLDYTNATAGLADPWASMWPELVHTPFFLAVGDGVGANLGSGCSDNTRIALTIGTTGAMRVVLLNESHSKEPVDERNGVQPTPAGLWSYPVDSERWLVGGSLTDGGSLFAWLHESLAVKDTVALLASAADLAPDAHGLTILPFLRGERAPGWATEASLSISGISPATTPAHIVRAAFEAVALRFRLIYDRLAPLLPPCTEIVASGGALEDNDLWRQILADVMQTPVHLIDVVEATSRGAAILAMQALDLPPAPNPPTVRTSLPDKDAGVAYAGALRRQQELYDRIIARS